MHWMMLPFLVGCAPPVPDDGGEGNGAGRDGAADEPCVSERALATLNAHTAAMAGTGAQLLGHGSERESVSFFQLPGYEGVAAQWAYLVEECSAPLEYDPWCDAGICWQIACTGEGASHVSSGWFRADSTTAGGFTFAYGSVDTAWDARTGVISAVLTSTATSADGEDFAMDGTWSLHPDGTATLTELFPGLHERGGVYEVEFDIEAGVASGELLVGETTVARIRDLELAATGQCPRPL